MRLADLTVAELRTRAKKRGLRGYSRLRKNELVAALQGKKTAARKSGRRRSPRKSSRRRRRSSRRRRSPRKSSRRRGRSSRRRRRSSRRRKRSSGRGSQAFKTDASWLNYAKREGYLLKMSDLKPQRSYKIVLSLEQGNTKPEIIRVERNNDRKAWTKENVDLGDDALFYSRRGLAVTGTGGDHAMLWTKYKKMPKRP